MLNIFRIVGGLILIAFIGGVFTTILLKFVVLGVYLAVGVFVLFSAAVAWLMLRAFRR